MDITTPLSAAMIANLTVSLFKLAWPGAPAWALLVVAIGGGFSASLVLALIDGVPLSGAIVAGAYVNGLAAAGMAAGISRADRASDVKREAARMGGL